MVLAHVAQGDPHVFAHNDERDAINAMMTTRTMHVPAFGIYFPEAEGAAGGAVDDTAAIRSVLAAASTGKGTVYFSQMHRVIGNLYIYGAVSLYANPQAAGGAGLKLDSTLAASDGTQYWINAGIQSKGGTVTTWTGSIENLTFQVTANGPNDTRMLNLHNVQSVVIRGCLFDARPRGTCLVSGPSAVNNNTWCATPFRDNVVIDNNNVLAAQNDVGGEAIDFSDGTNVWITRNRTSGWGDDAIAIHHASKFVVDGNNCEAMDGRILIDASIRGQVVNNKITRVAKPDNSWVSGGSLIHCLISDASYNTAPADIIIANNIAIHGTGITSFTYGIRLEGSRRISVVDNEIRDTSGFGHGVSWSSINYLTGWTDIEGVDTGGIAKMRDIFVQGNRVGNISGGTGDTNNVPATCVHYDMAPETVAVPSGGLSSTPSAGTTQLYTYTLAGNLTLSAPSLGYEGERFTIRLVQDATGGRTVTWPSSAFIKFVGGTAPVNTAANGVVEVGLILRGSLWIENYRITY